MKKKEEKKAKLQFNDLWAVTHNCTEIYQLRFTLIIHLFVFGLWNINFKLCSVLGNGWLCCVKPCYKKYPVINGKRSLLRPVTAKLILKYVLHLSMASRLLVLIIIVVIITWPGEKTSQKDNSDITVIRVSDSFKWVMFMQNFEHEVTVFNHSESIICVLLFSVCCF